MCTHPVISICPTIETSWGIDDTYDVLCMQCHQTVLAGVSPDKIVHLLNCHDCKVAAGSQYLPPLNPSSGKEKTD
ncbi:MAG: hypothetical protein NC318_00250 [Blautia sp.]|nr:hypothetical protein [Lachnoclostridium sp.]MCM1210017.1 hypothetical protein [Blautia sp.]